MKYPIITIIIATYNSERTLEKTLQSIKSQKYPKKRIEVLVIDGGSKDKTKNIAKSFNCKILKNPNIDPVSAKNIGFKKASGKYIMFLDSDEVLEQPTSLNIKYLAFQKSNRVKSVIPNGYKTPNEGSSINYYINEFGDPFSYFFYRESKSKDYLVSDWSIKYDKVYEDKNMAFFLFSNEENLPLIELSAGGCMVDLTYIRKTYPEIKTNPSLITHLFYLLNKKNMLLAITKNDSTMHYSSDTLNKYLKKLSSRVKNNIFNTNVGWVGFKGREKYQSPKLNVKKYLFIPYAFSIILPAIDSINLALARKKIVFLLHLPLCLYTAILILYFYTLKILGGRPNIKIYGN